MITIGWYDNGVSNRTTVDTTAEKMRVKIIGAMLSSDVLQFIDTNGIYYILGPQLVRSCTIALWEEKNA